MMTTTHNQPYPCLQTPRARAAAPHRYRLLGLSLVVGDRLGVGQHAQALGPVKTGVANLNLQRPSQDLTVDLFDMNAEREGSKAREKRKGNYDRSLLFGRARVCIGVPARFSCISIRI